MTDLPPHNLDAERAVLGACMLDRDGAFLAHEVLETADFYGGLHRAAFDAVREILAGGGEADLLGVEDALRGGAGMPDNLGELLRGMVAAAGSASGVEHHAKIVKEHATRRAVIKAARRLTESAHSGAPVAEVMENVEKAALWVAERRGGGGFVPNRSIISELLDDLGRGAMAAGWPTGLPALDCMLKGGGLHPRKLVIAGALPSVGKSSLALKASLAFAARAQHVAYFCMDDTHRSFVERAVACLARRALPLDGRFAAADAVEPFVEAANRLDALPIWVDDSTGHTVEAVRSRARIMRRFHAIDLVIVDYIQLMRAEGRDRYSEVTNISQGLKGMAKELDVCVMALSQFSRAAARADRPRMDHLRDSGQLEQDADVIMILHPDGDAQEDPRTFGASGWPVNLYLDKQKNGPTGRVPLRFFKPQFRFECEAETGADAPGVPERCM